MERYSAMVGVGYVSFILLIVGYFLLRSIVKLMVKTYGAFKIILFWKIEVKISQNKNSEYILTIKYK